MSCLNLTVVCFSFFALFANRGLSEADSALEQRLQRLWEINRRQLASDAWRMPAEERKRLLAEFNKRLFAEKWGPPSSFDNGDSIRVRLGDRDFTKTEVQKLAESKGARGMSLSSSGSPVAIEYLAPHAFSKEPYEDIRIRDVHTAPFSFLVTHDIFELLAESTAFNDEVANWARQIKSPDPESQRAELQRWWEENKVHFEREDYKAVKPGRPIPTVFEVVAENRRKLGLPPLEGQNPSPVAPEPTESSNPKQEPESSPMEIKRPQNEAGIEAEYWNVKIGLLVTLAVAALLIRRAWKRRDG